MFCSSCGKEILSDTKYCPQCGHFVHNSSSPVENKQTKKAHPALVIFSMGIIMVMLQAFLSVAVGSSTKNAEGLYAIFFILYIFLFICFLAALFRKPKQAVPAIRERDFHEEPKQSEKKHSGIWKWLTAFCFFIFLPVLYLIFSGPDNINPILDTCIVLIPLLFSGWLMWHLFERKNQKSTNLPHSIKDKITFLAHHPRLTVFFSVFFVVLISIIYLIFVKINNDNFLITEQMIPVIQDSLSEAAAAKIMGDSLYKGKYMQGASWFAVRTNSANASRMLDSLSVPNSLLHYKASAVSWSHQITSSAQNTNTWNDLAPQPEDFVFRASDGQVKKLFEDSMKKIAELKSFGENAIERKDRETMRYIAAKLLVQQHWINGIQHAKSVSFIRIKFSGEVLAYSDQDCYDIAVNCATQCAYSGGSSACIQNCADQLVAYCGGIDGRQPTSPPPPSPEPTWEPQPQDTIAPTEEPEGPTPTPTPYTYDPQPRNDVCIPGKTASYCAQEAVQTVNEIAASSIGFSEGADLSIDDWDTMFKSFDDMFPTGHIEGGAGITQGESALVITVPPVVQTFNNDCAAKGGFTGGANQTHGRMPTTESGYNCNYKQGANNCWDYLTYSGGRYMGGDVGCTERNLVPVARNAAVINNPPVQDQTPDWNGAYEIVSWSTNTECTKKNQPNNFNISGNVVYNPWGWGNGNPEINKTGAAMCSDNSCSYQFFGSGTKSYMTGTGLESAATCNKNSKCTKPCQFKITARHR